MLGTIFSGGLIHTGHSNDKIHLLLLHLLFFITSYCLFLKRLKCSLPALLNGFSSQQRSKNRIQCFLQVLNQNNITCCQCSLYGIQVPFRAKTAECLCENPLQKTTTSTFHRKASYPLCPMRITRRSLPYLFLIHLMP